jgi:trimeric autotransporter adhesin
MKHLFKKAARNNAVLAGGAVMASVLAGCGGSNNGPIGPSTNLLALQTGNKLLSFNTNTPNGTTTRNVTGLGAGETLTAIDFRFAPLGGVTTGLYGLAREGAQARLYRLNISGAGDVVATPVAGAFTPPALDQVAIDFNPVVDRIRLISSNRANLRLNPDTGLIAATDTDLAYAAGDTNAGQTPRPVAVAYTNNDSDPATGTINYVIDTVRDVLATQGRADDPATAADESVSPNTGQLFTVGSLGVNLGDNFGFDIAGANTAFLAGIPVGDSRPRLFTLNLGTGRVTDNRTIGSNQAILDIAVVP